MSAPTPSGSGFSFRRALKGLADITAPRSSDLVPILQLVVQASPAFPPLQSAAGGLLKIMETVQVRRSFHQFYGILVTVNVCRAESSSERRGHL